ncbi:hypothetical protein VP01_2146g2 [Puccinia sorghi]|uniref:Uncharacterized protein n=1 Tax=Puccinia sorghi TaxID=27349 RepID=A0A0L6V9L9_9BASI|nr:hypothetical protein VP01_2146g2 [Puccinia sorghi]
MHFCISPTICYLNHNTNFEAGKFPLLTTTMSLGFGQNWSQVRSVAHMGHG